MKKRKRKSVKTLAASKRVRRAVKRFGQSPSSVEDTKNSEKKKKREQKAREREEEEEEASNAIVQVCSFRFLVARNLFSFLS